MATLAELVKQAQQAPVLDTYRDKQGRVMLEVTTRQAPEPVAPAQLEKQGGSTANG